ncbi:hypothetical protein Xen7305DRAFT_00010940 [Xenococcus sp. PCC 7305]|uniref:DUF4112 domain-containing protein n=1 Tax=Xenococcus sp. PCC 7305 TaxID=102125 RepID=UPI0002AD13AE|nr:DUF4112 domain-containing protein [Xenococcus sp. PCC 7305]ELS01390.1 hypothetical protein Xen7305DRAFT_00010940 [Xenococcus sp. PCC 7305]
MKQSLDPKKINSLRRLSQILDNAIAIPGTKYRLGLDPILGLIPGGGDTIAGALGAYIIIEAARMGISREILWQMVANLLFDSVAGTVPVVGDVFDVAWKANVRNMDLLESQVSVPQDESNRQNSLLFLIGLTILLLLMVVGFATLTFFIFRWVWSLFN